MREGGALSPLFWVLVGWFALNAVLTVALIGKPREPVTPSAGVLALFLYPALIYALFLVAR